MPGRSGPGLYTAPGRAFPPSFGAAFALRPGSVARDLGWCDHDYPRWGGHNMLCVAFVQLILPSARHTGFSQRVGALFLTGLRPFALPRPDALSPHLPASPCAVSCVRVHQHIIPDNISIPLLGYRARSGWGYAELRLKEFSEVRQPGDCRKFVGELGGSGLVPTKCSRVRRVKHVLHA